jgi:hypothetical protein
LAKISDHPEKINIWSSSAALCAKHLSLLLATTAHLFRISASLLTVYINFLDLFDCV